MPALLSISFHSLDKDEKCNANGPKHGGPGGRVEENELVEVQARGRLHWVLHDPSESQNFPSYLEGVR